MGKDRHITLKMAQQFIDGALDIQDIDKLNRHATECKACRDMLTSLRHQQSTWRQWTARAHGTAYKNGRPENTRTVCDAVAKGLRKQFPPIGPLSELEHRRIQKRTISTGAKTKTIGKLSQGERADDWMLLAAAPRKRGSSSSALGLAVEEKSGKVFPVTVSAWVGEALLDKGHLSVVGAQVESRSKNGMEYKTTAPLTLLKEKLSKRFRTIPWLNHLYLHRREVYVELHNPQYFDKADSLLLAIIVAVSKAAAESKEASENLVYSADVDMQGNLMDVGRIHEKAGYIASGDQYRLVVSPGNYREVSAAVNKHKEETFISFQTVGELFDFLKLHVRAEKTTFGYKPAQPQKKRRSVIWKRAGLIAVMAALIAIAGLLLFRAQQVDHPREQLHTDAHPASFNEQQYHEFKALSVSPSRADLAAAVRMALKVDPKNPIFKGVFIRVSGILMDRVNNRNDAIQALSQYVRFVEDIKGAPDAEQSIADTIDPARDLMVRYGLSNHRLDGTRLSELISNILKELGIEK